MPVKRYGIYLAYPPTVELRKEGLGRHLAMFLKGAEGLTEVRFCIVCPSWTQQTLKDLFESEQVSAEVFDVVAPTGTPYALRAFEALRALRSRKKKHTGLLSRSWQAMLQGARALPRHMAARALAVHSKASLAKYLLEIGVLALILVPLLLLISPLWMPVLLAIALFWLVRRATRRHHATWAARLRQVASLFAAPHKKNWVLPLFDEMHRQEARRMQAAMDALVDVRAWYCPTAFWPAFNDIRAPRLLCVPDVVLSEFPAGFATIGGERYLNTFETIGKVIRGAEHFVTYSQAVKWQTLVDRYGIAAARVTVIAHAATGLSRHVSVSGFADPEATSRHYCQGLLMGALQRGAHTSYTAGFQNRDVKFVFYASQLRPNKNVLMLLRAYEHLLRKRYWSHKLILTGHTSDMREIGRFVATHRLENDVIFLHGLGIAELAACYKLADLAVNPSLSEGGCPFTFTEALSVGTPVLMARIAVAEEVLTDPALQEHSFFDPYDWRDCARRMEWALQHRDALLSVQQAAYARLNERTWSDVVAEHVQILDQLAEQAREAKP